MAQPGTICLISDDSDFRSRGGRETTGDRAARKSGGGGNLQGDKKVVLLWKKRRATRERNTLIGRLVEQFHFEMCMPILDVFFVTGS